MSIRHLLWPVFAGTLTLLSALSLTIVSAWLITRSWKMPPIMDITVAVTAVRALGISRAVFRYIDRLASHNLALSTATKARLSLWKSMASARNTAHFSRGTVLSRLGDDIDAVADVIVRSLIPALVAAVTSLIAIVFTALLSIPAAVILAIGLALAGIVTPLIIYRGIRTSQLVHAAALEAHTSAVEHVLADAPSLRIHGELPQALYAARDTTMKIAYADRAGATAIARGDALAMMAQVFTAIATMVIALLTFRNAHSPEWLTVTVLIPLAAFEAVAVLPGAAKTLAHAQGSLDNLSQLAELAKGNESDKTLSDLPRRVNQEPLQVTAPHLRATNLVTGYDHDLREWNLDLPFGTRKEIVAPSGFGKTTLLKTLAGLIPPRRGEVTVEKNGTKLINTKERSTEAHVESRSTIGNGHPVRFIAEDEHIFATTIRDNIAIGNPSIADTDIEQLIDALGLDLWIAALPDGLDTVLTAGGESLSGGQRRRLILARALSSAAPILLLDEPTEHVDTDADAILHLLLESTALPGTLPERTVIVVRHPRDK